MSFLKWWNSLASVLGMARLNPRADRVDENEIGDVEDRVVVVDETAGGWDTETLVVHLDSLRSECSEVQPNRRRSRTAVEREDDGSRRRIVYTVTRVGSEEERCPLLALLFTKEEAPGGCGVFDLFAADPNRLRRLDDVFLVMLGRLGRIVLLAGLVGLLIVLLLVSSGTGCSLLVVGRHQTLTIPISAHC